MRLFTVSEASQILRVTPKSVRDFINSGQLKASKIGTWRIKADDLLEFIKSRSNVAPESPLASSEPPTLGTVTGQMIIDCYTSNPAPLVTKMAEFINKSQFKDIRWQYTYDEKFSRARFTASGELAFLQAILDLVGEYY
ncbi:MAG TPA: helix-turn-helix domain-containing protein [Firmicutes bacterium]|nr:helix-turn-helix domain-containing protein [Candidatus Fermentithermobacillaceae bacterium]